MKTFFSQEMFMRNSHNILSAGRTFFDCASVSQWASVGSVLLA